MVWRGFSACGQTELAFLRGKQASKDYIKIIFSILTPYAKIHHKNDFDFHQDNLVGDDSNFSSWVPWNGLSVLRT